MTPLKAGSEELLSIVMRPDWSFNVQLSPWIWAALMVITVVGYLAVPYLRGRKTWRAFDLDQAEFGVGSGKVTFKPNLTDRQVAYSIWVELSTRKIGLEIDFEHDVVAEVFGSWYEFFGVTRELVKTIPLQKVRHDSTQKVIQLSIKVLNIGLRPLLTKWQARFRRWYERELNEAGSLTVAPQDIQKRFPQWEELKADMTRVNEHLIKYREKMHSLVLSE
jgi:hypothetical protein